MFELIIFGYGGVGILLLLYASRENYANNCTYDQRLAIIDSWDFLEGDAYLDALSSFRSVSYAAHKREVFWGRDPYKLYPHLQEVG